jgi:hypothetical protein
MLIQNAIFFPGGEQITVHITVYGSDGEKKGCTQESTIEHRFNDLFDEA